jgi:hypothetical protein
MKVPAEQLRSLLGVTDVNFVRGKHAVAIVDTKLNQPDQMSREVQQSNY